MHCALQFDSTLLEVLADSNHSCSIKGLDFDDISNNLSRFDSENRGRKIYSLLSSRNRVGVNVQRLDSEFDGDSLKLVPKVLECVNIYNRHSENHDVQSLSIIYELLRSSTYCGEGEKT